MVPETMKTPRSPLAAARIKARMTQFDLAHKAMVSLSTVVKLERGERVSALCLRRIALALGVKPSSLQP